MFIILIPAKYEASLILPETFAKINQKYNVYEIIRKYIKGAKRDTPIYA